MNRIDINEYSQKYENILKRIVKNSRLQLSTTYINNVNLKLKRSKLLLNNVSRILACGSKSREYRDDISRLIIETQELIQKMDDKFLLFIVGTGNYGKSTLINALLQCDIAPVAFKPKTWKIDVYYLDEDKSEKVVVKFNDGTSISLNYDEAVNFIEQEEEKIEKSIKKYNEIKNIELRKCKNKEERSEMIEKLSKEHIYKSRVVEVRWPVQNNPYLKNMLLVDTPGLVQDIYDIKGSIKDYYFKADGVIWLLDAQTISSSSSDKLIKELEDYLEDIGGLNNNIIGVVNKIDKISNPEEIEKVMLDAKTFFGDKFKYILPISSKNACNNAKDENLIELNKIIEDVFLSDSNVIKFNSKKLAVDKTMQNILQTNDEFIKYIQEINEQYEARQKYIKENIENMKKELKKELNKMTKSYLKKVNSNIETYTKNLFDIRDSKESREYVSNKIYNLASLQNSFEDFISVKNSLLDIEKSKMYKYCTLSEYKYINHIIDSDVQNFLTEKKLDLKIKSNFNVYTSLGDFAGDGLLDFLGSLVNELYKGFVKLLRINSVKDNLKTTIENIVEESKENILKNLISTIDKINNNSIDIVNKSYEKILFEYKDFEEVKCFISRLNDEINKKETITLKDVFY